MSQRVSPGVEVPTEARWVHNGEVINGPATIQYRCFRDGTALWWDGDTFQGAVFDFPMIYDPMQDCYRHIVIPTQEWIDFVVVVTVYMPGLPFQTDEITCDMSVRDLAAATLYQNVEGYHLVTVIEKPANTAGYFTYRLNITPIEPPTFVLYSDQERTQVSVTSTPMVATDQPNVFHAPYPELPPSDQYISAHIVTAFGERYDDNDYIHFTYVGGDVLPDFGPINMLRRMIGEPYSTTYTDGELNIRISQNTSVSGKINYNRIALDIWLEKQASYSNLTDINESGSERKLSQLYKNAAGQVKLYQDLVATDTELLTQGVMAMRVPGRSSEVWGGISV